MRSLLLFRPKAISNLPPEAVRKSGQTGKAEACIAAVFGQINGAKDIILHRKAKAEIDTVAAFFGQVVGMVPNVHFRMVEDAFHQWA